MVSVLIPYSVLSGYPLLKEYHPKLEDMEKRILELGKDPYIGTDPRYLVLKRQGYKVLILEKGTELEKKKKQFSNNTFIDNVHPYRLYCRNDCNP